MQLSCYNIYIISHGHKHTVMQLSCYNIYIISQVTMFIFKSWPQAHGDAVVMEPERQLAADCVT